jgi:DNA-binding NtrC family response regulator
MNLLREKRTALPSRGRCSHVIVADPDGSSSGWLANSLGEWGYSYSAASNYDHLVSALELHNDAIVVLDSEFDFAGGLAAYGQILLDGFAPRVVFLSDDQRSETAERARRVGARDFVLRSQAPKDLRKVLHSAAKQDTRRLSDGSPLMGDSSAMRELRAQIRSVAETDAAVMIVGESGTGKELVAKAIHECSYRTAQEFVPVNMAALPESLLESVLFGHEKGAFTGAEKRQAGLCQQAHNGTLFLDEIGEMNRDLQPKLLRFLQEHSVQRVGSTRVEELDVRVISATNRDLQEMIRSGGFREDLYFRLHVIPIRVPTLRERKDDIPVLANAFLKRRCLMSGRALRFAPDVMSRFCDYAWPGNVRQLENVIERMVVMARGTEICASAIPADCMAEQTTTDRITNGHFVADLEESVVVSDRRLTRMETAERKLIIHALRHNEGNVTAAARFLGLGQATIYRKIRTFEIPKITPATNGG